MTTEELTVIITGIPAILAGLASLIATIRGNRQLKSNHAETLEKINDVALQSKNGNSN